MRSILLTAVAALALSACGDSTPPDATASPDPSGTVATTNATIEPVPTATVTASPGATPTSTSSPNPMPSPTASPTNAPSSVCGANKAARFVGRTATPDVRAQVIEAVGHNRIRWIGPDTVVTMDYSEARLNADLTSANRITGFRCG